MDGGDTSFWSPVRSFTVFNALEFNKPVLNDTVQNPDASLPGTQPLIINQLPASRISITRWIQA